MTKRLTEFSVCRGAFAICVAASVAIGGRPASAQKHVPEAFQAAIPGTAAGATTTVITNALHLVVGRSMFVNTAERLRRVYISNPAVLDSMTASPNQIVVTAKEPGISSLILWDASGRSRAYTITADLDISQLNQALKQAFPMQDIHATGHEGQVDLSGTVSSPQIDEAAVKMAEQYSKNITNSLQVAMHHRPQVRLKVRVVEIDRSRAKQLGFNFFTSGNNTSAAGTGQFPGITVAPQTGTTSGTGGSGLLAVSSLLNLFYDNNSMGIGAAIQALQSKQILQILAEPTITAISGHKASFLSGGEFPFPVVQGGTGGFTSVTIQFRPYGVQVDFTPVVLPDGTIQLTVAPSVSALDYTNAVQISGYTVPAISTRRAETEVELRSGQSFSISGLLDNRTTNLLEKVPGIGDIPILGKLFQSESVNHSVEELAVIVTPTLVDPLSENTHPTQPKMVIPFINTSKFDKGLAPKKQQGVNGQ